MRLENNPFFRDPPFIVDAYWRSKEKPCPYAEGNRCFLVVEPSPESCKGCRWFEWWSKKQEKEGK